MLVITPLRSGKFSVSTSIFPIIIGFPALIIALGAIALILILIGQAIFSYLILSEDGLDFRLWPGHRIRCTWADVEQIKKSTLSSQRDILILKRANVTGSHILLDFRQGKFSLTKTFLQIPLYSIEGWPNGRLETELRKYRPDLFINQN